MNSLDAAARVYRQPNGIPFRFDTRTDAALQEIVSVLGDSPMFETQHQRTAGVTIELSSPLGHA